MGKVILIMIAIGLFLYAIDILICKISPKAGYIVAIFNLPFFPVGIVTFILTQKYLEKTLGVWDVTQYFRENKESMLQKKKRESSAKTSQSTAEAQAGKMIELVIPIGTTEIMKKEFENREDIISVVIPEGVKRIGNQAFAGCKNLNAISLPDDIIISSDAFLYCNKLSNEAEQQIADRVEGMYRKNFANRAFKYATPADDPNYDTTGEGLDINIFVYETRRAQNGEFYTVCFNRF